MKHEILFRGKRIDNGEWIEGDLIHSLGRTYCGIFAVTLEEVDPESVGQYTGLIASGKKIFEGDIIRAVDRDVIFPPYEFVALFGECHGMGDRDGWVGFYFDPFGEKSDYYRLYGLRNDPLYWLKNYDCEIIGNVFEGKAVD